MISRFSTLTVANSHLPVFTRRLQVSCFSSCAAAQTRQRASGGSVRTADLPGPYDLDIPTVDLAYEKHPRASAKKDDAPVPAKEPIIIAHGLFGSKTNTRTVSRVMARDLDRDVYCIDLRNHGDSPHSPVHTYPALAADIEHFIDKHKLGKTILIGHSMGAKAVMGVALRPRSSELVAALVSVDNSPWSAQLSSAFPKYVKTLQQIEAARFTKTSEAYNVLKETEPNEVIQQFLLSNMKRANQLPLPAKQELVNRLRQKRKQAGIPAGRHPHDHHPHRDAQGVIHEHGTPAPTTSSPASSATPATSIDSDIDDAEKHVLHFRVPLDIISNSLDYMADFPYLPFETRYNGPSLFVRGMKSH